MPAGGLVFKQNQVMKAEGHEAFGPLKALECHVGVPIRAESDRFEGRLALLIDGFIRITFIRGIELINDVDRLGGHPELRHEGVKGHDLLLLHAGAADEIVKLHTEHHFPLGAQLRGELLRHGREVLLLVQRLAEKTAQLGIDGFRVIVAQEAERGVDFILEDLSAGLGKCGEHLNEQGKQIRALGDAARATPNAAAHAGRNPLHAVGRGVGLPSLAKSAHAGD